MSETHEAQNEYRQIGIVACGAAKTDTATRARDLYTSSSFRMNLAAAIAEHGEANVLILSARHGLVGLDDIVAPYDVRMGDADEIADDALAGQIMERGIADADFWVFGGTPYWEKLWMLGVMAEHVYEGSRGIGDHRRGAALIAA